MKKRINSQQKDAYGNIKKFFISGDEKSDDRNPNGRNASFDYCFNYFQSFHQDGRAKQLANDENLQNSCLNLGFYLASWGMYRGSSFILQKSVHLFTELIDKIAKGEIEQEVWEIDLRKDAGGYSEKDIELLLKTYQQIQATLGREHNSDTTLVTKIMLGIFGNTPAFDSNFRKGFSMHSFNKKNLKKVADYYLEHQNIVDNASENIKTIDFITGRPIDRNYTRAKIIDMIGFMEGVEVK